MICYKDKTYCGSPNCKNECGRKFTEQDRKDATKWWGGKDFPVAYGVFCNESGEKIR